MHECLLAFAEDCAAAGGIFHPEWESCEPNPCAAASPVGASSWGGIKALYR